MKQDSGLMFLMLNVVRAAIDRDKDYSMLESDYVKNQSDSDNGGGNAINEIDIEHIDDALNNAVHSLLEAGKDLLVSSDILKASCPTCDGRGWEKIPVLSSEDGSWLSTKRRVCQECNGTGAASSHVLVKRLIELLYCG